MQSEPNNPLLSKWKAGSGFWKSRRLNAARRAWRYFFLLGRLKVFELKRPRGQRCRGCDLGRVTMRRGALEEDTSDELYAQDGEGTRARIEEANLLNFALFGRVSGVGLSQNEYIRHPFHNLSQPPIAFTSSSHPLTRYPPHHEHPRQCRPQQHSHS